ncbi:DNA (cytosine-5-)-methyltransferase [Microvirga sesbaniae]|uniref:DNA (cytosine-5-)-methyltransferase n=1 Tax=Microvirga sesbaniae TaxID=681392 RepID=UPI0021C68939|nr:DNA (cytosine-5-)-methyltransferase [Microvirga sp. HBU67692]
MKSFTGRDYVRIGEAAEILGISERTLRNWDRSGHLHPVRHPINGYRLYRVSDLHSFLREFGKSGDGQGILELVPTSSDPESAVLDVPQERSHARVQDLNEDMHWRFEVALDPKHRPQLWNRPSSTVRRDWRKYPQEAHILDSECQWYRRLAADEIAVIQGFAPDIVDVPNLTNRQRIAALGDAVPPPLAQAVAEGVLQSRTWLNKTAVEICAGIGGLSRGITAAGFESLALVDADPICGELLMYHSPAKSAKVHIGDAREFDYSEYRGKVGLLAGGPPCQPWSAAGLRLGHEDQRDLLSWTPDLLCQLEPEAFIFENVAGLIAGQNKSYFDAIVERLREPRPGMKYGVLAAVLNAADFGVPQIRERVFIIGFRDSSAASVSHCFDRIYARRTHKPQAEVAPGLRNWKTIGEAIEPLGHRDGWRRWLGLVPAEDNNESVI